ncbi:AAA family ATPase [Gloeocapsopsis dulcis]|uniref:AAA family ATPase n=1 Tax=Gloeocapsopsis dulcis AAB1 = 1H9 TaxID=1433147 RepID=A0A6N8FSB0_9CHRO|nr:AAA family ATPase [Gloeocapsopsis dulcis]MUL35077.1 AAA family ATPase [Gloeocapsopsis dulcis AAB1 = 1H9]WNN89842.1 AAA family ATPase [Gloeocapsopsis dulcis]
MDCQYSLSITTRSLILLIGLPGSGKSTLARQLLAEDPRRRLISSDMLRQQLFGSESIQGPWLVIWRQIQIQFQQTVLQISQGTATEAIYDATNAQRRHRREVITLARASGFNYITGVWVDAPIWLCLARNKRRDRIVPEEVVLRMHRQLRDAPPTLTEDLDCLILYPSNLKYGYHTAALTNNRT